MNFKSFFLANTLLSASASKYPELGKALASVIVEDKGEISITPRGHIRYLDWCSEESLKGKIRFLQVMGGTLSAKQINEAFLQKIEEATDDGRLPEGYYQTITIIDMRKCLFGTGSIVSGKLEHHKRLAPHASFVNDKHGKTTDAWALKSDSAIIALNEKGNVIFAKDGQLSEQECEKLIQKLITETGRLSRK